MIFLKILSITVAALTVSRLCFTIIFNNIPLLDDILNTVIINLSLKHRRQSIYCASHTGTVDVPLIYMYAK
jgi:hypothetical protein